MQVGARALVLGNDCADRRTLGRVRSQVLNDRAAAREPEWGEWNHRTTLVVQITTPLRCVQLAEGTFVRREGFKCSPFGPPTPAEKFFSERVHVFRATVVDDNEVGSEDCLHDSRLDEPRHGTRRTAIEKMINRCIDDALIAPRERATLGCTQRGTCDALR